MSGSYVFHRISILSELFFKYKDGYEKSTFTLNGFMRGSEGCLLKLEEIKAKIKKHFHPICGMRGTTESGAITVFYGGAFYVPTNEAELKRIQINLIIKEWKGDM